MMAGLRSKLSQLGSKLRDTVDKGKVLPRIPVSKINYQEDSNVPLAVRLGIGYPIPQFAMPLEPRFMFDAAGMATPDHFLSNSTAARDSALVSSLVPDVHHREAYHESPGLLHTSVGAPLPVEANSFTQRLGQPGVLPNSHQIIPTARESTYTPDIPDTPSSQQTSAAREFVFVDINVKDFKQIAEPLSHGAELVLVTPDRDGVRQIRETLAGQHDIDAIYIFCNNSKGAAQLGSSNLSLTTIPGYAADFKAIGQSLRQGGDIFLYGDKQANSSQEVALLDTMASDSRANVIAPDAADITIYHAFASDVTASSSSRREVVFVESTAYDYESLVYGINTSAEIVIIDGHSDGLTQISQWAKDHSGYDAIHIISHGSQGNVSLGSMTLNETSLVLRNDDLTTVGHALKPGGDLLLYGCDIASGDVGKAFITDLSHVINADVAASSDTTGASAHGGNWVLESTAGVIETPGLTLDVYKGLLKRDYTQSPSLFLSANSGPFSVEWTGDLDNNGTVDLVGNNGWGYYFCLGDGTGGFASPSILETPGGGAKPHALAIADINGDGLRDVIWIGGDRYLGTAIQNADHSFSTMLSTTIYNMSVNYKSLVDDYFNVSPNMGGAFQFSVTGITAADCDGDNRPEIAVSYAAQYDFGTVYGDNTVTGLFIVDANGPSPDPMSSHSTIFDDVGSTGCIATPSECSVPIVAKDFSGDGILDIGFISYQKNSLPGPLKFTSLSYDSGSSLMIEDQIDIAGINFPQISSVLTPSFSYDVSQFGGIIITDGTSFQEKYMPFVGGMQQSLLEPAHIVKFGPDIIGTAGWRREYIHANSTSFWLEGLYPEEFRSTLGSDITYAAAADINGDGKDDIILNAGGTGEVVVILITLLMMHLKVPLMAAFSRS